jgi:hypothetical protein
VARAAEPHRPSLRCPSPAAAKGRQRPAVGHLARFFGADERVPCRSARNIARPSGAERKSGHNSRKTLGATACDGPYARAADTRANRPVSIRGVEPAPGRSPSIKPSSRPSPTSCHTRVERCGSPTNGEHLYCRCATHVKELGLPDFCFPPRQNGGEGGSKAVRTGLSAVFSAFPLSPFAPLAAAGRKETPRPRLKPLIYLRYSSMAPCWVLGGHQARVGS